jgi:hypothetical protein
MLDNDTGDPNNTNDINSNQPETEDLVEDLRDSLVEQQGGSRTEVNKSSSIPNPASPRPNNN